MSESNQGRLAFNLTKFKSAARRESRKHPFTLPFLHNAASSNPKRSSTTGDLESGTRDGGSKLRNVNTAPESSNHSRGFNAQEDRIAESPTLNGSTDDSGLRQRSTRTEKDEEAGVTKRAEKKEKKEEKVKFGFIRHVEPKEPYTVANQLRATVLNSWLNLLLIAVPAGFVVNYIGIDGKIIFAVNFVAIIPLAALLSYGTEEVALRTGETIGGLINATFGYVQQSACCI